MSDNYFYYSNKYLQSSIVKILFEANFDTVNGELIPKTHQFHKMPIATDNYKSWLCMEPLLMNPKLADIFSRIGLGPFDMPSRIAQVNGPCDYATIEVGRNNSALIINLTKSDIGYNIYTPKNGYIHSERVTSILNVAKVDQFNIDETIEIDKENMTIVDFSKYKQFNSKEPSVLLFMNIKKHDLQDMKKLLLTPR
jgi:hypothetical protein